MSTNFKVIGLNRLRPKSKSTAPGADAFTIWPSELLQTMHNQSRLDSYQTVRTLRFIAYPESLNFISSHYIAYPEPLSFFISQVIALNIL